MTDERRTPNAPFRPPGIGRYPAPEPKETAKVEAAPAWAIKMQEGINANHTLVVGEMRSLRSDVEELKEWRKTGKHAAVAMPPDGPQTTTSGEVRRISQSDIAQNKAITGLSENQVALSDKVDALDRKATERLDSQDREIALVKTAATTAKDNTVDIKREVTGFFKQHPELGVSLATLLGVIITLATAWLQAKVHP